MHIYVLLVLLDRFAGFRIFVTNFLIVFYILVTVRLWARAKDARTVLIEAQKRM